MSGNELVETINNEPLRIDLPKFKEKNIYIEHSQEHGYIDISAHRETVKKSTGERITRSFSLSIDDPALKNKTVKHSFNNGVLEVNIQD